MTRCGDSHGQQQRFRQAHRIEKCFLRRGTNGGAQLSLARCAGACEAGTGAMRPVTGRGVGKGNRRPSTSWGSLTTVGNATRPRPSPSGGSLRRSEWLPSSKPSRLSFNAASMIAPVRSVYGFGASSPAITNTMLSPATSINCVSSESASIGCGTTYWCAVANARGRGGRDLLRS